MIRFMNALFAFPYYPEYRHISSFTDFLTATLPLSGTFIHPYDHPTQIFYLQGSQARTRLRGPKILRGSNRDQRFRAFKKARALFKASIEPEEQPQVYDQRYGT